MAETKMAAVALVKAKASAPAAAIQCQYEGRRTIVERLGLVVRRLASTTVARALGGILLVRIVQEIRRGCGRLVLGRGRHQAGANAL